MRVAIVGGGPSGIAALKAFLAEPAGVTSVKVFERRSATGGAWNHTPLPAGQVRLKRVPSISPLVVEGPVEATEDKDSPGTGDLTWLTPMYDKLNTNIPANLMAYHDVPFEQAAGAHDFPSREKVLQYLAGYAKDIVQYLQLNAEVLSIVKRADVWKLKWSPSCGTKRDGVWEDFDRIVIASGHYETIKIPDIPGISAYHAKYPERIHHSKYYRSPEVYKDKRVLVVGSGPSGTDIARQISEHAITPVWRSIRSATAQAVDSANVIHDVAQIRHIETDGSVVLLDGTVLANIDRLVFCTGYLYSFPYLEESTTRRFMSPDGEYLRDLYEQVFCIDDPTLAFLAMGMSIVPFPIAEAQSCYVARVWTGRLRLPRRADMTAHEERRLSGKAPGRRTMYLGHPDDGKYIDRLREKCLQASPAGGLLPVDWLNSDRVWLRQHMGDLKRDWLLQQQQHNGTQLTA
ncbi:putative Flavin dependent monooxygenase [Taphrina deformans PYCC 5710]|uniref:Flavin dependent monooxygenase n=1 Tax=Taphrina deformans (strain PYCC 5710 / ATCC 11124 / CBS 356.35 / IMI 108563 / JCM 9778 / NBRC 8474) TaxID=1097556 RepID=R4XCG2_TAPDE|nr:putative Flavin dependent monooxygenase [Taphrina deformans PYCC 5710]|eukprot:CCG83557.1 putative Flavin dependent monooxygenase [Taphrina deformans PYCC 5710]